METSDAAPDSCSSSARSSRRKRETPSRLDDRLQQRLSWCAKQVEPPEQESTTNDDIISKIKPTGSRRKTAKKLIRLLLSKNYDHSVRLVPADDSHKALFRIGEFHLWGTNLDLPGIWNGAFWAIKSNGDMHLLWEESSSDDIGYCKVTTEVPQYVSEALGSNGGRTLITCIQSSTKLMLSVGIMIPEKLIFDLSHQYELSFNCDKHRIKKLMGFFYGIRHIDEQSDTVHSNNFNVLYQKVLESQRSQGLLPINTPIDCPLKELWHLNFMSREKTKNAKRQLQVTLRDYQREAVAWMCRMETEIRFVETEEVWQTVEDGRGRSVQYNRFAGCFASKLSSAYEKIAHQPGGILADEMGLGKTLEVIALILTRPRPGFPLTEEEIGIVITEDKKQECRYTCETCNSIAIASCPANISIKCPQCWASLATPLPIKTTLIVCPATIREQWTDEINWLVGECNLRVFVYRGVSHHGYVPPDRLNQFDLILSTYEVLRKEIHFAKLATADESHDRELRAPKRRKVTPSPLVSAEFWRVALDEAQMVESCAVNAAQMVLQIPAVNRWCVTGTPIHRDLSDLYGLFVFLRLTPYDQSLWFEEMIQKPYVSGDSNPLVDCLSKCFRRMDKQQVWSQLELPAQHTHVHELHFSPVEEVFYRSQAIGCSADAFQVASKFVPDAVIWKMARSDMIKLLEPLKKLRQACSHPQAVRGTRIAMRNSSYNMDDLLVELLKRTVRESEEAHRRVISSLNGLAGLALLCKDTQAAVNFYRQVLWSVSYYAGSVRADPLQQFHTFVNLSALLEENDHQMRTAGGVDRLSRVATARWSLPPDSTGQSGYGIRDVTTEWPNEHQFNPVPLIPRFSGDDSLMVQAYQVRDKYLSKYIERQRSVMLNVMNNRTGLEEMSQKFRCSNREKWYISFIEEAVVRGDGERLIRKLKDHLLETKGTYGTCLVNRFSDCNGLKYLIQNQLDVLYESRGHLLKVIEQFSADPTKEDIQAAISCHLRPMKKKRPKCRYCLVLDILLAYEVKLFSCDRTLPKNGAASIGDIDEIGDSNDETDANDDELDKVAAADGPACKGTWQLSDIEKILTFLASLAKTYTDNELIQFDGSLHCDYLASMRKEFKGFSLCYRQTRDYVAALDELEMAAMKFELAPNDQIFKNSEKPSYVIHQWEIDDQAARLHADKKLGEADLRKWVGQLVYLRHLEKANKLQNGTNTDICPTCHSALGERWCVFHCGHNVCVECLQMLLKNQCSLHNNQTSLRVPCPMCRESSSNEEIFHVDLNKKKNGDANQVTVAGNHSTKVIGVVETLLKILKKDFSAKCLVFSVWPSVLIVLQEAFKQNGINSVLLTSGGQFQQSLKTFKKNPQTSVLLMPIKLGSKGLNLTEASHVILVEPLLDAGDEVQALGRIHRIGQKKETHVHRFIVMDSIEEKLNKYVENLQVSQEKADEKKGLTVAQMVSLFIVERNRYIENFQPASLS